MPQNCVYIQPGPGRELLKPAQCLPGDTAVDMAMFRMHFQLTWFAAVLGLISGNLGRGLSMCASTDGSFFCAAEINK